MMPDNRVRLEGRLLFALLDAVQDNGMMANAATEGRWRETKKRITRSGDYRNEAADLYELLAEVHSSGALAGTWMESRWLTVKDRLAGPN